MVGSVFTAHRHLAKEDVRSIQRSVAGRYVWSPRVRTVLKNEQKISEENACSN
jgi:hypothetical protein